MKELNIYQKIQLALLAMVIGLFVVLVTMRILGYKLPDDLQGYMMSIWAIMLILIDARSLHDMIIKNIPGATATESSITTTKEVKTYEDKTTPATPAA